MLRAYKTEINPTEEQKKKINQSIGVCRFLYNSYLAKNQELHNQFKDGIFDKKQGFMSANNFDKYINNEIKVLEKYSWINLCGSKARKKTIVNAETAYKRFFNGLSCFPKFKKKNKQDVKLYFPKNNKTDWKIDRYRINIPTLKWIRLKEKGYIPTNSKIVSGTVSKKADRYFVSVVIEEETKVQDKPYTKGMGIDVGLKEFVVTSNGIHKKNINKTERVKNLEKKLIREQRKLSRKYESLKLKNKNEKEDTATRRNIKKQIVKVQKLHQKLTNVRTDYVNKTINSIVKQNPSYITIEDLAISNMMKNRHLSKAIAGQKFYEFRVKLEYKCKLNGIELRVVDRFYPSSKTCSVCGAYKKDLKLSDRIYKCTECKSILDRDYNASINLENAKTYKMA